MHKSFDGFGKALDDDNPLPQYRSLTGMVEWRLLFRKDMNLKVRKCRDGGCRIAVTEVVSDPLLRIVNVYMASTNGGATDDFDAILLELQEILDKFSNSHAVILLGDMNSSLLCRENNDQDKKLLNFCSRNGLASLQHGVPTFYHVNGKDTAEIDYILLKEKAKFLANTMEVELNHVPVYTILKIRIMMKTLKPVTVKLKPKWDKCDKKCLLRLCF